MSGSDPAATAFLGLVLVVGALASVLVFAVMRFVAAARAARRGSGTRAETALLSAALEEALARFKAEQRATVARAEASERLSEQIVAGLTSGLIVVDRAGHVQIVNPAARRILRLEEAPVQADYRVLLAELGPLVELIREGLEVGRPIVRRTITVARGGAPTHLGVTVSPIAGADGMAQAAVCLFTDLTTVIALEEQLRLKEALAELGEMTAGLAHEFRNGLATIHGYARLLDPATLPDPARTYVEGLRHETQALGEVVSNFLNFARPEPLRFAPVDLADVVARGAEDAPPGAEVVITGSFGELDGDEVLLRQAFSNLVRNAGEAADAAGRTPRIEIAGQADTAARTVRVTVRDNGPGIPAEALDRLFRPFFTTRPQGTGLGLAIVQKVVVSHNGQVTAQNGAGGGAEFVVQLPLRADA